MTDRFMEGEQVLLVPPQGGQPDQGLVLKVEADRVFVRWHGLRCSRWERLGPHLVASRSRRTAA